MAALKDPFLHLELMTKRAEDSFGNAKYVFILKPTYKTDGSEKIIIDTLQYSADVCNGFAVRNDVLFPFVRWEEFSSDPKRKNSWTYLSKRIIPNETVAIEAWMKDIAKNFPKAIITEDTPAALLKIKWHSTDIPPKTVT